MTYLNIGRMIVVSMGVFISCGDSKPGGETEQTGTARLSLTNAPADADCLQITVTGARTVVDTFTLTPGESTTFLLRGLPLGGDQFSAAAYPTSCDAVTPSSVANWVSDPVATTLTAGIVVDIVLVMHRNGRVNVSIDFQEDPDAGTGSADSGQLADAGTAGAACSPEFVTATGAQAAAAVQNVLANMDSFCLPGETVPVATSTLSICSTAACANIPNTCVATLAPPVFTFEPASLTFTATADTTVSGGVAGAVDGIPLSCNDLVITAPGTLFSGNLIPTIHTIQTIPNVPSATNVLYTVSNVVVHADSLNVSGCSVLGGAANLAAGLLQGLIEQTAANSIQGRTFVFPCTAPGAMNGTGGSGGAETGNTGGVQCTGSGVECGSRCVDVVSDPTNCGACGVACTASEVCSVGICALQCSGSATNCFSSCFDLNNDPANCGRCSKVCGPAERCSAGICGP